MSKREPSLAHFEKLNKDVIQSAAIKSERIDIRVSPDDKESIQIAAKLCHCTVSEYLVRIHNIAVTKLGTPSL